MVDGIRGFEYLSCMDSTQEPVAWRRGQPQVWIRIFEGQTRYLPIHRRPTGSNDTSKVGGATEMKMIEILYPVLERLLQVKTRTQKTPL